MDLGCAFRGALVLQWGLVGTRGERLSVMGADCSGMGEPWGVRITEGHLNGSQFETCRLQVPGGLQGQPLCAKPRRAQPWSSVRAGGRCGLCFILSNGSLSQCEAGQCPGPCG